MKLFSTPDRKDLVYLLDHVPLPTSSLTLRWHWLSDLMIWFLSKSPLMGATSSLDFSTGHPQALRVKWFLHKLNQNEKWKFSVHELFISIVQESRVFDLLVLTGLHRQPGLFSEFFERFQNSFLPHPASHQNLEVFFDMTFKKEQDAYSFLNIDQGSFAQLLQLFSSPRTDVFSHWQRDTRAAVMTLSLQVSSLGLDVLIRERINEEDPEKLPFVALHRQVLAWRKEQDLEKSMVLTHEVQLLIEKSFQGIDEVRSHMDEKGVSVELVYQLQRLEALLRRMKVILNLFQGDKISLLGLQSLMVVLVLENIRMKSFRSLWVENTSMLAKKMTEKSAETGEHYIARSKKESFQLFLGALGGGALTVATSILKVLISSLPVSPFFAGVGASINYAGSFVLMQMWGFTLATKQPSMTAATLASQLKTEASQLVDTLPAAREILHLLRSQLIAVSGNILAVVPGMLLFCLGFEFLQGHPFLSHEKAQHTLESFAILGPTPFYAAWTGVLLFLSSLVSGWFHHWMLFRKIPQGLARSRNLQARRGVEGARKFSLFFRRNAAAWAGSISLGLFLGLSPFVAQFFGLPLDVRHVTLSSAGVAASIASLGVESLTSQSFVLAVLGVLSMAFFNLLVSFLLALVLALRSKEITGSQFLLVLQSVRTLFWGALFSSEKKRPNDA